MVAQLSVRITRNDLKRLARAAPQKAEDALSAVAFEGERFAKANMTSSPSSPGEFPGVDTGALKNSIHVVNAGRLHRQLADGVEYGAILEWGSRFMAARPFFAPTSQHMRQQIPALFDEFLT